jgi:hypothetical protein
VGFYFTNKVTSPMAKASFLLMLLSLAAKETKFAGKVRAIHFRDFTTGFHTITKKKNP